MKREEILKIIDDKDAQDKIFVQRGEEKAKYTEEIFHIIKQGVMDDLIKIAVDRGYWFSDNQISLHIFKNIINSPTLKLSKDIAEIYSVDGMTVLVPSKDATKDEVEYIFKLKSNIDTALLENNFRVLLRKNGFSQADEWIFNDWTTTKEKLLSYPEIIYNGFDNCESLSCIEKYSSGKSTNLSDSEDTSLIAWQILGVVIVLLVLFLCKVYF